MIRQSQPVPIEPRSEELAASEETCHLILSGEPPSGEELDRLRELLLQRRPSPLLPNRRPGFFEADYR